MPPEQQLPSAGTDPRTDEELVRVMQSRETADQERNRAFDELMNRHKDGLFQSVYNWVRPRGTLHDAEEIVLETFVRFWKNVASFQFKSAVYTYIYRIALNATLNFLRTPSMKGDPVVPLEDVEHALPADEDIERSVEKGMDQEQLRSMVARVLEAMPPGQRIAFMLAVYEHKSYREIAEIMDTSVASVESLLFRARQQLKKVAERGILGKPR